MKIYKLFCLLIVIGGTFTLSIYAVNPKTTVTLPIACYDSCFAIDNGGSLYAWGDSQWGTTQGLFGFREDSTSYATANKIMDDAVFVTAGQWAAMAIDTDGVLWGWGFNGFGHLPGYNEESRLIRLIDGAVMASMGFHHALTVKNDHTLWAWGYNDCGQFADGAIDMNKAVYAPRKIMDGVIFAAANGNASYAILEDESLWMWGAELPLSDLKEPVLIPTKIEESVASVAPTPSGLLILKTDGTLWARGNSTPYIDATYYYSIPTMILDDVASCAPGAAVRNDGSLWTWGDNSFGQLGDGTTLAQKEPFKVMEHVAFVSAGINKTMVVTDSGKLYITGEENGSANSTMRYNGFTNIANDIQLGKANANGRALSSVIICCLAVPIVLTYIVRLKRHNNRDKR